MTLLSGSPALLLYAPAVLRHDLAPVGDVSVRSLPAVPAWRGGRPLNTVIIPAAPGAAPAAPAVLNTGPAGGVSLAPLFCLLRAGPHAWLPYTLMSYTGGDLLYVALPLRAVHGDPAQSASLQAWAAELSACHRRHLGQINNHQCWFRNLHPGVEIEHKFTLPAGSDIWRLAVRTHQLVTAGDLAGWVCEHGNNGGFEQWDFINHLFAITEPEPERGYIAFIPAIDGRSWIIRRKRYARDQEIRREDLTEGVCLGPAPDLGQVIRDRFGLSPAWGATYRRVRYNVMLESLATGHVYSIMYDRCTTARPGTQPLEQAEVEYLRSRTLRTTPPGEVLAELHHLTAWTRNLLGREATGFAEDDLSKLTWLRPPT